jgi:hypothetical protein
MSHDVVVQTTYWPLIFSSRRSTHRRLQPLVSPSTAASQLVVNTRIAQALDLTPRLSAGSVHPHGSSTLPKPLTLSPTPNPGTLIPHPLSPHPPWQHRARSDAHTPEPLSPTPWKPQRDPPHSGHRHGSSAHGSSARLGGSGCGAHQSARRHLQPRIHARLLLVISSLGTIDEHR